MEYYSELIDLPNPFVPRKFRVKTDKNALPENLVIKRQQAIGNVKREISIMKNHCNEWSRQLTELKEEIHTEIRNTTKEENMTEKMNTFDKIIKDSEIRNQQRYLKNLHKLKGFYNKEMTELDQCILIFTDKKTHQNKENNIGTENVAFKRHFYEQQVKKTCKNKYFIKKHNRHHDENKFIHNFDVSRDGMSHFTYKDKYFKRTITLNKSKRKPFMMYGQLPHDTINLTRFL